MDIETKEIVTEIGKETVKNVGKEIYVDGLKPTIKEIGKAFKLIPETVNALFADLKIWTMKRNNCVDEVEIELEKRLEKKKQEDIINPDYGIFIPALQSLSYNYDKEEIRNIYFNLLESLMDNNYADKVHPCFNEIVKQINPYEARLFKKMATSITRPYIYIKLRNNHGLGEKNLIKYIYEFVDIGEQNINLDYLLSGISNLERLGLIEVKDQSYYPEKEMYANLKNIDFIQTLYNEYGKERVVIYQGIIEISELGKQFAKICLKI